MRKEVGGGLGAGGEELPNDQMVGGSPFESRGAVTP